MQDLDHRQKVYERMKEVMANDRTKHNILPLSKFGLMQITRQRVRPEMHIDTEEKCPSCLGTGTVSPSILLTDKIENAIRLVKQEQKVRKMTLWVHPYVYAFIKQGFPSLALKWKWEYGFGLRIVSSASLSFLEFKIETDNKEKTDLV